jgi:hypothetical protein
MGFLAKLFGTRASGERDDAIHVYVECERCHSRVHVRLDKRHDLSQGEGGGYFVRKEIMDSKCFRLMTAEMSFDAAYRVTQQALNGGRFVSADEYRATQA